MMLNNNAIQIFKTFSKEELKHFEKFILSPTHNKNKKVVQLFYLLKEFHPDYSDKSIAKENLYFKLTGDPKYTESYIRNLFSDLAILAEKFLRFNLSPDNHTFDRLLIEELKNRDLYELAGIKLKAFEKKINLTKIKDHEYYLNKTFIYEMKSFLIVDKTLTDNFRKDQIAGIIKLFMIILMENSFYLRIEEQRVEIRHNFGFLKNSLDYMENHLSDFYDSPLVMIYYHLCMYFINHKGEKHFEYARKYFRKNFKSLTKIDKKNIYSMMQIYYIDKLDAGDYNVAKDFLHFMLDMLKSNILSHKKTDSMNLNLYRNILLLCMMENEKKILEKFIAEYIGRVDRESRKSTLSYSNAHLEFLKKNYEKTLTHCNEIDFGDFLISTNDNLYFKIDIKTLILKCLYELGLYENVLSNIDAFRHFLRNSRLIKDKSKIKYNNFLNLSADLIKLKLNFDEFNLRKIIKKIDEKKVLIQISWLHEKADELSAFKK